MITPEMTTKVAVLNHGSGGSEFFPGDVVNEKSGDGRSIRMIQHTTWRIVVKDYVFCFFDYVGFIVFTKLELVIICFLFGLENIMELVFC
ncbi:hypothetical protein HanHA89_Chr08g0306211 [Helianthus annuus]|nr:hypothetical protein HanHA89_Chr08g0306211 [Helianthus annuus]